MKHHETTNQTKSPTLPLGRQLHFAKLLRHKSRHIMKLFPTLHLAAASDPVAGAAATVIRRLQGSAELQQQRHHLAVAFLGRHQQRRQTSGGHAEVAGLVGSSRSAPGSWEMVWECEKAESSFRPYCSSKF